MVIIATDVFKSFEVDGKDGIIRLDEGNKIRFCTESGEIIKGTLTKISGKGEKAKIQIIPEAAEKEEIWSLMVMAEGSLELDKGEDSEDDE